MKKRSILEFLSSPFKKEQSKEESQESAGNKIRRKLDTCDDSNVTPKKQSTKESNNTSLRKSIVEDESSEIGKDTLDEIFESTSIENKHNNEKHKSDAKQGYNFQDVHKNNASRSYTINDAKKHKSNANYTHKNDLNEKHKTNAESSKKNKEEKRFDFLVNVHDKNYNDPTSDLYDPSSLFISENDYKKFTPFEKQFWDIKKEYFDTIIFFKKGKFYELYENDADIANKEFGLRVTERVNMRMAGVPESSFEMWSSKFLEKGYKIGRVDQAENAIGRAIREKDEEEASKIKDDEIRNKKTHKKPSVPENNNTKILSRELKEIITPGTIYNHDHIKNPISVYTAVLKQDESLFYSIILYDASINEILYDTFECKTRLFTILAQFKVIEIITDIREKFDKSIRVISPIKGGSAIKFRECFSNEQEYVCFLLLTNYMKYLFRENFLNNLTIKKIENKNYMILDSITLKNLEIFENSFNKTEKNTFFSAVNFCTTNAGKRKLKKWVLNPLLSISEIKKRQELTQIFENIDLSKIQEILRSINDTERIMNSIFGENPTLKDLIKFKSDIENFIKLMHNLEIVYKQNYQKGFEEHKKECEIRKVTKTNEKGHTSNKQKPALDDLRTSFRAHELFFDTFFTSFPDLQQIVDNFDFSYKIFDNEIEVLNENHKIQVQIKNLKQIEKRLINYLEEQKKLLKTNLTFKDVGKEIYQIEVQGNVKVPENYFLVSNTKTCKRYYTNEVKLLVKEYIEFEERLFQSKGILLREIASELKSNTNEFYKAINIISEIDCYTSFATYNKFNVGVYPEYYENEVDESYDASNTNVNGEVDNIKTSNKSLLLSFEGLNNPVYKNYVENDLKMESPLLVLTGPNMGGKSTFLRSVCLNIILGQIGLKVNCKRFNSILFDRIFTRLGANDDLMKGQSTFAVELTETSIILNELTKKSFVIFDELGRGTSTKDGECIAKSVIDYVLKKNVHCIFSTHYTNMVKNISCMKGYMKVLCENDFVFLYKIGNGVCEESHGIEIAKFAGVNEEIIKRALEIKKNMTQNYNLENVCE